MAEIDTFGITLPVSDWRRLFELARRADRSPSDYLRTMIRQEAQRCGLLPTEATQPVKLGQLERGECSHATAA